jgi:murein DD-endopeptidase MepM/ murein hydrolase activator NlpD
MRAPFPKGTITSLYGATENRPNPHRGLDFGVPAGFPIRFGANGTVMFVRWSDCLGWVISYRFLHKGKVMFAAHSHLRRKPKWKSGDKIKAEDVAGLVGNTGACSRGAHLHLTVGPTATHVFVGKTIDPLKVLEFDK